MIITCSECNTHYTVPSTAIGLKGKKVKCSSCGHKWHQMPQEEISHKDSAANDDFMGTLSDIFGESPEEIPEDSSESGVSDDEMEKEFFGKTTEETPVKADQSKINEEQPKKDKPEVSSIPNPSSVKKPLKASRLLKIASIVSVLFAIFVGILVSRDIAGLDGLYKALGMQNTDGLVFEDFYVNREENNNSLRFVIEGDIINESKNTIKVPDIIARILSKGGREMDSVIIKPKWEKLLAGERMHIKQEIENVSGNADKITLDIGNEWELYFR